MVVPNVPMGSDAPPSRFQLELQHVTDTKTEFKSRHARQCPRKRRVVLVTSNTRGWSIPYNVGRRQSPAVARCDAYFDRATHQHRGGAELGKNSFNRTRCSSPQLLCATIEENDGAEEHT